MGKRLLRATILRPLVDAAALEARYEAVAEAHGGSAAAGGDSAGVWRDSGFGAAAGAAELDSAGPRDVRALAASLARLPGLKTALEAMTGPQWRAMAHGSIRSKT
jgi:DNA mismatch repair protein MutS